MNINITLNQLSEICYQYSQGMKSLSYNDNCHEYNLFLEHHFGPSHEFIDELDIDLYEFQFNPLFYLHQVQPQQDIEQWIDDTKQQIKTKLFDLLQSLMEDYEDMNHYVLYFTFLDSLSIPTDTFNEDDIIYKYFMEFSEENF